MVGDSISSHYTGSMLSGASISVHTISLHTDSQTKAKAFKHDCAFGERDLHLEELVAVSEAILHTGRQIVYSIAPGENATPVMAAAIANMTNLYRVSAHIWDTWVELEPAFNIARDFAASGLVGASGLGGGRSWPDLDVLPFGWLTDGDTDNGPYRSSRLTDSEMKTQMTLWGMARSPLMFGGDMRHLDQTTLDVLTNPTVLEINSNSFGNTEILRFATDTIKVAECGGSNHTRWNTSHNSSQICWRRKNNSEGCYKWIPHANRTNTGHNLGRVFDTNKTCLDAKASHGKNRSEHFSPCRDHPSQTWKLTPSGDLVNDHLGRCAISVSEDDLTRIWVSYGHSGEVYVAFFNASPKKTQMSITLEELLDEFYTSLAVANSSSVIFNAHNKTRWRCLGEEVWSGKRVEETHSISFRVDGHGCALFVLSCNYNLRGRNMKTLSRVLLASFVGIVVILTLVNLVRYCWLSQHKHRK
ncbi:uncharacterized protein LOC9637464 isoform X2 [Selaginella moellendorffii]|uniref:uncharacterized protein LOC9637464 isoform X2 n=1 Tax=Selaginella moellendorffii TaxID=88036 RepID=UPI000D1CE0FE|nr:uncharacterized protein LOC9637464 isoform X2 [Selaginella moellendorffii]|eukprot:XP_024533535.1 uncharacterized protein LOC9637464 isoform X2 [Selaginella moellendorffii]